MFKQGKSPVETSAGELVEAQRQIAALDTKKQEVYRAMDATRSKFDAESSRHAGSLASIEASQCEWRDKLTSAHAALSSHVAAARN